MIVRVGEEGGDGWEETVLVARGFGPDGLQESQTVCVQGGKGRPQSSLHALWSWRRTGPGAMEDYSQSLSLHILQHITIIVVHCIFSAY